MHILSTLLCSRHLSKGDSCTIFLKRSPSLLGASSRKYVVQLSSCAEMTLTDSLNRLT